MCARLCHCPGPLVCNSMSSRKTLKSKVTQSVTEFMTMSLKLSCTALKVLYSRFLQTKWPDLEKSRSCWDCPCFHMYQDSLNPFHSSRQNTKGSPPCQSLSSIQILLDGKPWRHTLEYGSETFWCASQGICDWKTIWLFYEQFKGSLKAEFENVDLSQLVALTVNRESKQPFNFVNIVS